MPWNKLIANNGQYQQADYAFYIDLLKDFYG